MRVARWWKAGAVLVFMALAPLAQAQRVAMVGGTLVEGQRIVAVGTVKTLPVPADATVISTEGMTVMPGLWDMHVHLMINGHADYDHWDKTYPAQFRDVIMPASAKQLLLAGVTTIPRQFVSMIPYVVTIVAVSGFVGRVRAPAAVALSPSPPAPIRWPPYAIAGPTICLST